MLPILTKRSIGFILTQLIEFVNLFMRSGVGSCDKALQVAACSVNGWKFAGWQPATICFAKNPMGN
jgi:hypothetical protein